MSTFERITQNPAQMGGKACIRNMRVTVGMIVGQIGIGRSIDELLADYPYPYLEREDVLQALRYAAWLAEEREVVHDAGYCRKLCGADLTNDLDFGAVLAASSGAKPSVVQIRGDDLNPNAIGAKVIAALRQLEAELRAGALVTVDLVRTGLRILPMG